MKRRDYLSEKNQEKAVERLIRHAYHEGPTAVNSALICAIYGDYDNYDKVLDEKFLRDLERARESLRQGYPLRMARSRWRRYDNIQKKVSLDDPDFVKKVNKEYMNVRILPNLEEAIYGRK